MWPVPLAFLRSLLVMTKKKPNFYAVARGRTVGIYSSWPECEQQVKGWPGARHKGFDQQADAIEFIKQLNWDYEYKPGNQSIGQVAPSVVHAAGPTASSSSSPSPYSIPANNQADEPIWLKYAPKENHNYDTKDNAAKRVARENEASGVQRKVRKRIVLEPSSTGTTNNLVRRSSTSTDMVKGGIDTVRTIEVYTDGASSSNGKINAQAGWGVYWPESEDTKSDLHGRNESGRLPGAEQTNNRAELMGIIRAIQLCPDPSAQLIIYSDSQYSIKALSEWQWNWRKNKWLTSKKEAVVNKDLIRLLERELRNRLLRPQLIYVKGHSINVGNQEADKLAVAGAKLPPIPPHLWPDYEPSDSEDESLEVSHQKAVNFWVKAGFSETQAKLRAAPLLE